MDRVTRESPTVMVPRSSGADTSGPLKRARDVSLVSGVGVADGSSAMLSLQRSAISIGGTLAVPPIAHEVLGSPGQPLDQSSRAFFEPRFGHDFSRVKVHSDARAGESALAVNALAYTVGHNVVFGAGRYSPSTREGKKLLAHELVHVLQQHKGHGAAPSARAVSQNAGLEQEADQLAATALRRPSSMRIGQGLDVNGKTSLPIAQPKSETSLAIQRQTATPAKSQQYATRRAHDFFDSKADHHTFYELLAHEISYRGDLDGKFLYRAYQSFKREQPLIQKETPSSTISSLLSIEGITPGVPATLGDNYAIMSTRPEIPPPIPYVGGANPPTYYQVHMMEGSDPSNKQSGLLAYYLIPTDAKAPKIVVFRGTEPKAADIKADADKKGVGATAFQKHQEKIESMLTFLRGSYGDKTVVTGHSLGGALAQWTTAAFPDLVDELVTFNSPGISGEAVTDFNKLSSKLNDKTAVSHYVTRGDLVSTAGEKSLPGTTTMMEGRATRDLEQMLESGRLKKAENSLAELASAVTVLAYLKLEVVTKLTYLQGLLASLYLSGGLSALEDLGGLLGELHGQRLLRTSEPMDLTAFPEIYWGQKDWKPLAPDVKELAAETRPIAKTNPTQVSIAAAEAARASMSKSSAGVDVLFNQTVPFISKLKDHIAVTIAQEALNIDPPLMKLAKDVEPIFSILMPALAGLGGLERFIEQALYYQPKPSTRGKADWLKVVPDALMTKPTIITFPNSPGR